MTETRIFTIERRAPDGALFAPDAFDAEIGADVPLELYGVDHGTATVRAVEIRESGLIASLTVEAPDTPELAAAIMRGK